MKSMSLYYIFALFFSLSLCAMEEGAALVKGEQSRMAPITLQFKDGSLKTFKYREASLIREECKTIVDMIKDFEILPEAIPLACSSSDFQNVIGHLFGNSGALNKVLGYSDAMDLKDEELVGLICTAELCGVATEKVPFRLIDKKSLDKLTGQEREIYKQALVRKLCASFPLYKLPQAIIEKFKGFHPEQKIVKEFDVDVAYLGKKLAVPNRCSPYAPISQGNWTPYELSGSEDIVEFDGSYYLPVDEDHGDNDFIAAHHLVKVSPDSEVAQCITKKYTGVAVSEDGKSFAYAESKPGSITIFRSGSPCPATISLEDLHKDFNCNIFFNGEGCLYSRSYSVVIRPISPIQDSNLFSKLSCATLLDMYNLLAQSKKIDIADFIMICSAKAPEKERAALQELFGVTQSNNLKKSYLSEQRSQSVWSALRGATIAGCSFLFGKMLSNAQSPLSKLGSALKWGSCAIGGGWAAYNLWQAAKAQRSLGRLHSYSGVQS